ncbi:Tigger transposable element-derived protein 6 [Phytophthora citrophthora]|uniref:Tigger transposable element-derived protein 6 n=1 Tax=Phytophthora citrophthora TaxID=4793 RepID=A0AAD9G5N5_9STRA|nr:Tigger transposable element-derived protein 6 [Phytophthora citrophthora]
MQDSSEDIEAVVAASTSHDDTASTKRRKHYSVKLKRHILTALDTEQLSLRAASRKFGVPRRSSSDWVKEKENILSFKGSEKTLARTTGTPELIPFSTELVTYMKDIRAANDHQKHPHWIAAYTATKAREDAAYEYLLRLMRRFAYRHGFSRRTPHGLKEKQDDLNEVQKAFSCKYDELYGQYDPSAVFNIDETGVYYDTPPSRILCERGKSTAITTSEKNSARLPVVCSVRGDGQKLPLFFILRGAPGGYIKTTELPTYPKGWMDSRVWPKVLREVMPPFVEGPSVLLVDNLDCHVSQESVDIVAVELFSTLQPLPKNSTSVCQPLNVSVICPLKAKLRTAWLLVDTVCKTAKEERLATIRRVILAWESISDDTVRKSFNASLSVKFYVKTTRNF